MSKDLGTGSTSELLKWATPVENRSVNKPASSDTPYQANMAFVMNKNVNQDKWYKGDSPTAYEIYGRIGSIYQTDPTKAAQLYSDFNTLQNTPGSKYYWPYGNPTNSAVAEMAGYGYDTSKLDDDWFNTNVGLRDYYTFSGSTNTPSKPGAKASQQEKEAYGYYQLGKADPDTKKVDTEWAALQEELYWKVQNPNRNDTDQEIYDSIDWNKYPTLKKLNESVEPGGAIVELNRGTTYSPTAVMGTIWAARNQNPDGTYGSGNDGVNIIYSAMGEGNQYVENPEIRAKLDPNSGNYIPYSLGATAQGLCMYFGVYELTPEWRDANQAEIIASGDETKIKMFNDACDVINYSEKLDKELADMNAEIDRLVAKGYAYERIVDRVFDNEEYKDLFALDDTMDPNSGKMTELKQTGWAIDYKKSQIEQHIFEKCNPGIKDAATSFFLEHFGGAETEQHQKNRQDVAHLTDEHTTDSEKIALQGGLTGSDAMNAIDAMTTGPKWWDKWKDVVHDSAASVMPNLEKNYMYGYGKVSQYEKYLEPIAQAEEGMASELKQSQDIVANISDRSGALKEDVQVNVDKTYEIVGGDESLFGVLSSIVSRGGSDNSTIGAIDAYYAGKDVPFDLVDLENCTNRAKNAYSMYRSAVKRGDTERADRELTRMMKNVYAAREITTGEPVPDNVDEYAEQGRLLLEMIDLNISTSDKDQTEGDICQYIGHQNAYNEYEKTRGELKDAQGITPEEYVEERRLFDENLEDLILASQLYEINGEQYDVQKLGYICAVPEACRTKIPQSYQGYNTYLQMCFDYQDEGYEPGDATKKVMETATRDAAQIPLEVKRLREAHDILVQGGVKFTAEEEQNFNDYCDYMLWEAKQAYYFSLGTKEDFKDVSDQTWEDAKNGKYNTLSQVLAKDWQGGSLQSLGGELEKTLGIGTADTSYDILGDRIDEMVLTLQNITKAEKQQYFYILGTSGEKAATQYMRELMGKYMRVRNSEEFKQRAKNSVTSAFGSIGATALSIAAEMVSTPIEFFYRKNAEAEGRDIDPYSINYILRDMSEGLREGSLEQLYKKYGNKEIVDFLYNAIYSAGKSAAVAYITGLGFKAIGEVAMMFPSVSNLVGNIASGAGKWATVGKIAGSTPIKGGLKILGEFVHAAPMGVDAMEAAYRDAYIRSGGNKEKANKMAQATFWAETLSEAITFSNMHGMFNAGKEGSRAVKDTVINVLKDLGEEAFGESANQLIESECDKWIMGADSNWQANYDYYISQNYDPATAASMADSIMWKEVLESGMSAIASAGMTDVGSYAAGTLVNTAKQEIIGKNINKKGGNALVNQLYQIAQNSGDERLIKRADKVNDAVHEKGKAGDLQVGKMTIDLLSSEDENVRKQTQEALGLTDEEARQTVQEAQAERANEPEEEDEVFENEQQTEQQTEAQPETTGMAHDKALAKSQEEALQAQESWRNQRTDDLAKLLEASSDETNSGPGTTDIASVLAGSVMRTNIAPADALAAAQTMVNGIGGGKAKPVADMVRGLLNNTNTTQETNDVKEAMTWAALTDGQANKTLNMMIERAKNGIKPSREDAQLLMQGARIDQTGPKAETMRQTYAQTVVQSRVDSKVADFINSGELGKATKTEQKAVDDASETVKNTKKNLDQANREAEASAKNLLAVESEYDPSVKGNSVTAPPFQQARAKRLADINQATQAQIANENAKESLNAAKKVLSDKTDEVLNGVRTEAQAAVQQDIMAEERARVEAEENHAKEVALKEQQQVQEDEQRSMDNLDAEDVIRDLYPNATEEEQARIREIVKGIKKEMSFESRQKRANFVKQVESKFGHKIQIADTTMGGMLPRQNAYVDLRTGDIVVDETTSMRDILYAVLPHELMHIAESSDTYNELAQSLIDMEYGEDTGRLESDIQARKELYSRFQDQMAEQDENYQRADVTDEYAKQELVADLMGKLLSGNEELINRFVQEKPSVARRFVESIKNFLKRIAGVEGAPTREMLRTVDMFEKALKEAGTNNANAARNILEQGEATPVTTDADGTALDGELRGGTVVKESLSSWTESEQSRVLADLIKKGFARTDAENWIRNANGIAAEIAKDIGRLDYVADPTKTMLKPNAEYVKTLDASTLCAKRLVYQGTFDAIQHALPNTPLMPTDLIDLANMMREMGYEAPCGICYVESRRRNLGKFAQEWLDSYDGSYKPTLDQVTTTDGLEALRESHPDTYQDFVNAMNKKGTMNPKVVQMRTDYRGEISQMTPGQIQKVKDIGGLRVQSFSDFETPHLLDMTQAVMDMASKGLTSQAYTKVPNFAWVFGGTGIKINLSLIGKGTGLDADGNLVFDNTEGMNYDEAMKVRNMYSKNVGTILVGINDAHILAAMADPNIDFIIPFHKSGWSAEELSKMPVLESYDDYTSSQNEKKIVGRTKDGGYKTESLEKSKQVNFQPVGENGYWDFSKTGKENAETYLKMCAEDGRLPKFSQFLVDNGDGSFSLQPDGSTDGYWKTLIDFKMYDNEGNGSPQTEVTPNINMNQAMRVLNEFDGKGVNSLPVAQPVVDRYVEEYKAKHPLDATRTKYSIPADAEYMADVERGEIDKADEEVRKYAEEHGYTDRAYHGTPKFGFTVFDMKKSQNEIFVSYNKNVAGTYSENGDWIRKISEKGIDVDFYSMSGQEIVDYLNNMDKRTKELFDSAGFKFESASLAEDGWIVIDVDGDMTLSFEKHDFADEMMKLESGVYDLYTRPGKQLVIEGDGHGWSDIPWGLVVDADPEAQGAHPDMYGAETREISKWARENGYDSVRINGIYDDGGESYDFGQAYGDVGIFFNQKDIKSADTVVYDDEGNIIPPSERFTDSPDIRRSLPSENLLQQQIRNYLTDRYNGKTNGIGLPPGTSQNGNFGNAQRQFGRQTAQTSDALHQDVKDYLYNNSSYTPDSNKAQIDRAVGWVQSKATESDPDGYYTAVDEVTGENFDYRSADGQARMLTVMSMAALKDDVATEMRLADAYNRQGTDLGRQLQARKIFRLMTPLGRQSILQNEVRKLNDELGRKGNKTRVKLSDDVIRKAGEAKTEEEFAKVQKQANRELAEQMPSNWRDRMRAWRMTSMLFNPRTHVRNIIGNALFVPAVGIKNKLGALMELGMKEGNRTKTLAPVLSKDVRAFAMEDARTMKDVLTGEAKYNEETKVEQQKKIFGTGNGVLSKTLGRAIQWANDVNSKALEGEDWFFLRGHYRKALGGWMMANGYTSETLKSNPALLEQGRAYAVQEAQKATYRDFNKLAQTLNQVSRQGNVAGFVVDAVLPFKKTPANILRRGTEYSLIGVARSLTTDAYHLKQYRDYNKGKLSVLPEKALSPNQFIDRICSGLTGTAIMAVGAILANMGVVSVGLDDDDDKFDKEQGDQEYAVRLKLFGMDATYTMDWAAPMSMPFFVGAAIQKQFSGEGDNDIEGIVNAMAAITEPVFNLSMLDGINTLFKTNQYSSEETNPMTQIGAKVLSNYATSYVPSAAGTIARIADPYRRKAFVESGKSDGAVGTFRYAVEQTKNKIPGLSQNSIPYRDIWGNPQESGAVERHLENLVSPGYYEEYKNDPIISEMQRVYDATNDKGLIFSDTPKSVTVNKQKIVFNAQQYDQYAEVRGQTAHEAFIQLMESEGYQNAPEEEQAIMIKNVWTYANQTATKAVAPEYKMDNYGRNPVNSIIRDSSNTYYKNEMMKAIAADDWDAYDTMVEALRENEVEDTEIKSKIAITYRDQYKDAYRTGDIERMLEIEETLDSTDLFKAKDFRNWEKQVDEEEEEE